MNKALANLAGELARMKLAREQQESEPRSPTKAVEHLEKQVDHAKDKMVSLPGGGGGGRRGCRQGRGGGARGQRRASLGVAWLERGMKQWVHGP